jgi:hypothetical protein
VEELRYLQRGEVVISIPKQDKNELSHSAKSFLRKKKREKKAEVSLTAWFIKYTVCTSCV